MTLTYSIFLTGQFGAESWQHTIRSSSEERAHNFISALSQIKLNGSSSYLSFGSLASLCGETNAGGCEGTCLNADTFGWLVPTGREVLSASGNLDPCI